MNAPVKTSKLIKGATGDWEVVIGMEVHAQVNSQAKLFSGAATDFGAAPNSQVSLVDAAMPGMLPVINAECVAQAVRTGLGLKAKINLRSVFDRKNYFYPDLPQGYQISQYKSPIVGEGEVVVDMPDGAIRVGIERLHLEQDAGKLLHDQHPAMSLVDLNRSGVALMEIVSKPDLRSAEEAKAFLAKLRAILRYLGTCDGNMEKGNLRADVNVSVRRPGDPLGTRCEIKNVNSIRFVGHGRRLRGAAPDRRHRGRRHHRAGDAALRRRTRRDPGDAHQGRSARLSLLPRPRPAAARTDRGLRRGARPRAAGTAGREEGALHVRSSASPATTPASSSPSARAPTTSRRWSNGPTAPCGTPSSPPTGSSTSCSGASTRRAGTSQLRRSRPPQLGTILDLMAEGTISGKIAKDLFEIVWSEGGDPRAVVEARGMKQVTDVSAIEKMVDEIVAENPDKAEQARPEAGADRLVRRAGDEGVGRQGEPAGGERSSQGEARFVIGAIAPARRAEGDTRRHRRRPRRTGIGTTKTAAGPSQALARSIRASVFAIGRDRFARFSLPRTCRIRFKSAFRKDVRRIFFAAKIARGGAARRLRRVVANAVKPCLLRCARVFRHGCNAQFAMAFTIQRI